MAEAVADLAPDARFLFVGGRRGLEAEIVPAAGLEFHATPFPSLRDPGARLSLVTRALLLPVALVDALWHVARFRPSVCLTSGGAVAFPVVLAASALGVPVALWTGDVVPGRANRALARWASRIAAAFPGAEPYFKKGRVEVTGNPIRRSLLRWTRADGRRHLGIADDEKVVLVTGGSQGSARINEAVGPALPRLLARATVLHHVGPANVARAEARRETLTCQQRERSRPFGFLKDD
ncbi:MAG TPA: UDP-N-acetylglucosamine--N-acetylmuramyl-(pentapeptide) pyrophosphoryl-undecaprenol N-acetylglucosamine transferase, partial [Candidatus Limnocylindria bacterium]|nr:UDP-N-acetylglucosamine--N-acetylmuramyl-(pentapeptide) pyrophosphoryl-undecaprenol N-acetylglucosamine transferase [Candidatus Limnocylindria bacterium]